MLIPRRAGARDVVPRRPYLTIDCLYGLGVMAAITAQYYEDCQVPPPPSVKRALSWIYRIRKWRAVNA